jgi:hypothetical protein
MKNSSLLAGAGIAAVALLSTTGPSFADATLLNLVDPAQQSNTPTTLKFKASSSSTSLTLEGYKVGEFEFETAENIGVFLSGTTNNLLGVTWTLSAAAEGKTEQFSDSSSVNAVGFAAGVVGGYSFFGQTFATTAGSIYTAAGLHQSGCERQRIRGGDHRQCSRAEGHTPHWERHPRTGYLGDDAARLREPRFRRLSQGKTESPRGHLKIGRTRNPKRRAAQARDGF